MRVPSGDQRGSLSLSPAVSRRGFARACPLDRVPVGYSHSSVTPTLRSIENDVTLAHARLPSGASVGAPMRLIAHSASTSSGGLVAVERALRAGMSRVLSE